MKKVFLLIFPLILSGCTVNFIKDPHAPGLDNSSSVYKRNNSFYGGDSINKAALTAHEITFVETEDEIDFIESNIDTFTTYCIDNDNIIQSVESLNDVSTFFHSEENEALSSGIKVGYPSKSVNGDINFLLAANCRALEVFAYPRYGVIFDGEGSKIEIDSEKTGISANGSSYIAVATNQEFENLQITTCSFNFASESNKLNINVYGARVVITKIIIYC